MSLQNLFDQYLKSGLYLRGWSPKTAVIYQRAFTSFQRSSPEQASALTKATLEAWIIRRREAGMSPSGINMYIRAMNSFSAWMKEEGHAEQIILKQLKAPQKVVVVFSAEDIRRIVNFKSRRQSELRTWTMLQLMLDTGCRINEIIELQSQHVDLDNLLLIVDGKGGKQRKVPFSVECRKTLYRYIKDHPTKSQVFLTRTGTKVMYDNMYREIQRVCRKVGITKRVHPHLTRHTFACHFMKNGGSIYTLSRILGHSSVSTTQIYIRGLGVEDFQEEHSRLSPLSRLR
jgi:integrase/recombinase XerD